MSRLSSLLLSSSRNALRFRAQTTVAAARFPTTLFPATLNNNVDTYHRQIVPNHSHWPLSSSPFAAVQIRSFAKKKKKKKKFQMHNQRTTTGRKELAKHGKRRRDKRRGKSAPQVPLFEVSSTSNVEMSVLDEELGIPESERLVQRAPVLEHMTPKERYEYHLKEQWESSAPSNRLQNMIFTGRGGVEDSGKQFSGKYPNPNFLEAKLQTALRVEGFLKQFQKRSQKRHNRGFYVKPTIRRRKYREELRVRAEAKLIRATLNYLRGGQEEKDYDWATSGDVDEYEEEEDDDDRNVDLEETERMMVITARRK